MDKPYGVPADFAEHFKLMSNMIAIAFQADQTRIVDIPDDARRNVAAPIAKSAFPTAIIRSRIIAISRN